MALLSKNGPVTNRMTVKPNPDGTVTQRGEFSLDDASPEKIEQLMNLGRGEAVKRANLDAVKQRFLSGKAPVFVPVHAVAS